MAEKINSLCFRDCRLSIAFKIELFSKCHNLMDFYYKNTDEFVFPINSCFTREIIESLLEKQVVNEKLKSLRVYIVEADSITGDNIESLFNIFPSIEHLTFDSGMRSRFFPPTLIPKIISMKHKLTNLKIRHSLPNLRSLMSHRFTRF